MDNTDKLFIGIDASNATLEVAQVYLGCEVLLGMCSGFCPKAASIAPLGVACKEYCDK